LNELIDSDLRAASLGVLVILGVGIAGQYYLAGSLSQPFSEIGILGPSGDFAGYPTQLSVGTNYTLNLFVANHEGQSMMYEVYQLRGNQSSIVSQSTPMAGTPVSTYYFVLPNDGNSTYPVTVELQAPGLEIRLVWELWYYSSASNSWTYEGSWAQLYVNATA
jgi:uncharacterized membrane protein